MKTSQKKYQKVASHEANTGDFKKCLLLYSGGLDTSILLKWIQEKYNCEVVTLTVNLGQTADDLDEIQKKAFSFGASEVIVYDAVDEFADEFLTLAVQANANYQNGYALSCPLGRVLISKIAVEKAH